MVASALHAVEQRPNQRDRQKRRRDRLGCRGQKLAGGVEIAARVQPHLPQCRAQFGGGTSAEEVVGLRAVALQHVERQIELAPRRMQRERPQQPGDGEGDAGVARQVACAGLVAIVEDARGKLNQRRRRVAA